MDGPPPIFFFQLVVQIFEEIGELRQSLVAGFLRIHVVAEAALDHEGVLPDMLLDPSDQLDVHMILGQVHGDDQ